METNQNKNQLIFASKTPTKVDGRSLIRVNMSIQKLVAFLQSEEVMQHARHSDKTGEDYIDFIEVRRKEVGEKGETHFIAIDTYKPAAKDENKGAE